MKRSGDTPHDSPLTLADVQASSEYRDLEKAKVAPGDPAVDLVLRRSDEPGACVRLSDYAGSKPVALIFGSYT